MALPVTPHYRYDYDSAQVPILADITWKGSPMKAMLWANRNGIFYMLDRATGKFLLGKPFVKVNWMKGFDEKGKPIQTPLPAGLPVHPGSQGGTNWYAPSYSPRTGLMYIPTWEDQAMLFGATPAVYKEGLSLEAAASSRLFPLRKRLRRGFLARRVFQSPARPD